MTNEELERERAEGLADEYFDDSDLYASDRQQFIAGYTAACKDKRLEISRLEGFRAAIVKMVKVIGPPTADTIGAIREIGFNALEANEQGSGERE